MLRAPGGQRRRCIFEKKLMENLVQAFSQFGKVQSTSSEALSMIAQELHCAKGHILLAPDSVCKHLYFIKEGLTRTFYLKDGRDITDWFSPENTFAVSLISYIKQQPDRRGIEVLEPSVLYSMYYDDLEMLCTKFHDIEHIIRKILSFGIVQMQNKIDDVHFVSGKHRYRNLIQSNPSIVQRVPLGMVASFLGMTQESLSRIRSTKI